MRNENKKQLTSGKIVKPIAKTKPLSAVKLARQVIINEIIQLRLKKGYSTSSIIKYLKDEHNYQRAGAYVLYKEASEQIGETFQEMNQSAFRDSVMLMENMLEKALEDEDTGLALNILKEMNRCNQLYVQKLELQVKGEPIVINIK